MTITIVQGSKLDAVNHQFWIRNTQTKELLFTAKTEQSAGMGLRVIEEDPTLYGVPSCLWCEVLDRSTGEVKPAEWLDGWYGHEAA